MKIETIGTQTEYINRKNENIGMKWGGEITDIAIADAFKWNAQTKAFDIPAFPVEKKLDKNGKPEKIMNSSGIEEFVYQNVKGAEQLKELIITFDNKVLRISQANKKDWNALATAMSKAELTNSDDLVGKNFSAEVAERDNFTEWKLEISSNPF